MNWLPIVDAVETLVVVVDDVVVLLVVDWGVKCPPRPTLFVGANDVDTVGSVETLD